MDASRTQAAMVQPTIVYCLSAVGVAVSIYTCGRRWWCSTIEPRGSPITDGVVSIGRSGPVNVLHMVGPRHASKREFLHGSADSQVVTIDEIDPAKPLLAQFEARIGGVALTLFKLHSALAAPHKLHNSQFLVDIENMYDKHRPILDEMSVVPLAGEKLLADRFVMMGLLKEVCAVVSGAFAKINGCSSTPCSADVQNKLDSQACICEIPIFMDVEFKTYSPETFDMGELAQFFPFVIKPRDSSNHADMALVFDEVGLNEFVLKLGADFRVEQFIEHGGRVLKVFVLDTEIRVGERKSLPNVTGTTPAELSEFATGIDGTYRAGPAGGLGYVEFDAAVLTKGRSRNGDNLDAAQKVEDVSGLDPQVVTFIAEALAHQVGTRLLGFDMLIRSEPHPPVFFLCDCNVFPGYKGVKDADVKVRQYLIRLAADRAVKEDTAKLDDIDTIRKLCVKSLPGWAASDDVTVERISNHSNHVFKVGNSAAREGGGSPSSVIFRLFGRGFGPKGIIENQLVRDLSSRKVGADWITDIYASYFGKEIHLGRIEEMLQGNTLTEALSGAHRFAISSDSGVQHFESMCACIGTKLAGLHGILEQNKRNSGSRQSFIDKHFPEPRTPKAATRLRKWRLRAEHAMHTSSLRNHPIWKDLFEGFNMIVAEIDMREKKCMQRLRTAEARATVFGHFDPNLSNLIVMSTADKVVDVHLIDFEWAGPNIAVYDFAKFITSVRIKRERDPDFHIAETDLQRGMKQMAMSYLASHANSQTPTDAATVRALLTDIYVYIPVVAAVNFFSNIIHASKEGLLSKDGIPSTRNLRFGEEEKHFNWLAHAHAHLEQYKLAVYESPHL